MSLELNSLDIQGGPGATLEIISSEGELLGVLINLLWKKFNSHDSTQYSAGIIF